MIYLLSRDNYLEDDRRASPAGSREKTPTLSTGDEAESSLAICEHIKPSGVGCGSPALRGEKFCYYHSKVRKTVPKNNLFVFLDNPGRKESDPYYTFEFPYLEDAAAVQIGFMQFIYGVSQQRIEEWRARMILSALHGAAANLRLMEGNPRPSQKMARTGHPGRTADPSAPLRSGRDDNSREE